MLWDTSMLTDVRTRRAEKKGLCLLALIESQRHSCRLQTDDLAILVDDLITDFPATDSMPCHCSSGSRLFLQNKPGCYRLVSHPMMA